VVPSSLRHTLSRLHNRSLMVFAIVLIAVTLSHAVASATADYRPLMRYPDIHDDMIVFVYGEDIWTVAASGGVASRITIHDGEEKYPKFSPDGSMIAFTGEYDGNADVYVMDAYGGNIRRVTYHPGEDAVVGWHQQKNKIMFRSSRTSFAGFSRLFLIAPDGTGLEELILNEAATGSFSPDGSRTRISRISPGPTGIQCGLTTRYISVPTAIAY
jgi:tricorn protease